MTQVMKQVLFSLNFNNTAPSIALSLDEGLNALSGKNASAAGWFSRPIKCQILARM